MLYIKKLRFEYPDGLNTCETFSETFFDIYIQFIAIDTSI